MIPVYIPFSDCREIYEWDDSFKQDFSLPKVFEIIHNRDEFHDNSFDLKYEKAKRECDAYTN
jgi:hypothetical protein